MPSSRKALHVEPLAPVKTLFCAHQKAGDAISDKQFHAVSFSGGKDSTAMLLLMVERGMPIDAVLTADTGMEFPEMYRHWDRVEQFLLRERGLKLMILRHPKGFEWLMFDEPKEKLSSIENRRRLGVSPYGNGWPGIKVRWCTGQLKTHLINKEVNRLKKEHQALHYVGIAADELERVKNERYPLVDWGITERGALQICYDRGYDWGGLYEIYHRCSCWCCPFQRIDELRKLRRYHPELWAKLLEMDDRALAQFGDTPLGRFKDDWTVAELEERFSAEDTQLCISDIQQEEPIMDEKKASDGLADMLQGVPPKNILISFDDKPAKTLEEHIREQQQRKKRQQKKHKSR